LTPRINLSGTTMATLVRAGEVVRVKTGFAWRRRQNGPNEPTRRNASRCQCRRSVMIRQRGRRRAGVSGAAAAEQNRADRLFLLLSALFFSLFPIVLAPPVFSPPCQGFAL
jgi:hypothetical protein